MHEHEYKARDKTVNKMGRSGLEEENLSSGESERVSRREQDSFPAPGKEAGSECFQKDRPGGRKEEAGRRRVQKNGRQMQNAERERLYENVACGDKTGLPEHLQTDGSASGLPADSAEEYRKQPSDSTAGGSTSGLPVHSRPASKISGLYAEGNGVIKSHMFPVQEDGALAGESDAVSEDTRRTACFDEETGKKVSDTVQTDALAGHPSYTESICGHPHRGQAAAEAAAEIRHRQKKRQVREHFKKEGEKESGGGGTDAKNDSAEARFRKKAGKDGEPDVPGRVQKRTDRKSGQVHDGAEKKASRLSFDDSDNGMVRGSGMGIAKKAVSAAAGSASVYVRGKWKEAGQENAAVEGFYGAGSAAGRSFRYAARSSSRRMQGKFSGRQEPAGRDDTDSRLQFGAPHGADSSAGAAERASGQAEKNAVKRFWQKQRIKKSYQEAKRGRETAAQTAGAVRTASEKLKHQALSAVKNKKGIFGAAAVIGLLFLMLSAGFSSCSAMLEGASSSIIGSTYPGTDEDIRAAEDAYAALEDALNRQVNSMESVHPGFDEYLYQVDEISHNPYQLASYFTVKYGGYTYAQAAGEIEEIFREQYRLSVEESTETVTETKTVRVGEPLGPVVTSGYCSCPVCCGIWSGGPTASGAYPKADHTLAVDAADPFVPIGTKVVMNGVEYVVEDTGAFASYGVQFDVYYADHAAAAAHGHQTWEAYLADSNGNTEVEVTSSEEVKRLKVTLTNRGLDAVLRSRMDADEVKRYDLYNLTYGNRDYLFDAGSIPAGGGADGSGYEVPAEALSDEKFAKMIREAEKYLGFPYVWGGASPDTSFDCSGFVSWVVNNCGNGWSIGRQTAEGLRGCCAYVAPEDARPGDLIFFQGTYATSGASHVGIYAGNHMMIHCGSPIQYTNINSNYWKQHFMSYGRLQ